MNSNQPATKQQLIPNRNAQLNDSFELLYTGYVHKVYQKCLSMTGDSEEAYDHTQDIFLKVLDRLSTFQQRSSLSTWLYTITYNHCIDTLKRRKRYGTEPIFAQLSEQTEAAVPELEDGYLYQLALLNQLPKSERLLLKMRYEQRRSIKEIGQQYGIQESAVKMRLKRTRDRLKMLYSQHQNREW